MTSIFDSGGQGKQDPFGPLRSLGLRKSAEETGLKGVDRLAAASRKFRRPHQLRQVIQQLDLYVDPQGLKDAIDWIKQQYDVHDIEGLAGLFSRCYLGHPYVDHRMTIAGGILEHYEPKDLVPAPYSAARVLAANPSYDYIEIYADGQMIPIYQDGSAGDPVDTASGRATR